MAGWRIDPVALGLTLVVGTAGGALASLARLPLAFMLGALLATALMALLNIRPLGRPMTLPNRYRSLMLPVIGLAIGGAFGPGLFQEAAGWWPTMLALVVYLPLAHLLGITIFRLGGLGRAEAFYGAFPGGLIESIQLAEEAGADARIVSMMHFMRVLVTILGMTLIFVLITGGLVGSATGAKLPGADALAGRDLAILVVLGIVGFVGAKAVQMPAGPMLGPMVLSAAAHMTGLVHGVPPDWLLYAAQVVVGCGLGARFADFDRSLMMRTLRLALISALAVLALGGGFALVLAQVVPLPATAVYLAYAPAGQAEMSLIALSLDLGVVFVAAHHLARLVLTIFFMRLWTMIARRRRGQD